MLVSGAADIGVATETLAEHADLSARPFYQWRHIVIAHKSHPLAGSAPVDLERLARWPLITYQQGFTGRARIDEAFAAGGLTPDVAITALDADVIKSYVELGLGVGIVAEMAYAPNRDSDLVRLDAGELFAVNTTWLAVKRGRLLRAYVRRFLDLASSG
jgi:LysR family cys regulon transcriptional activator